MKTIVFLLIFLILNSVGFSQRNNTNFEKRPPFSKEYGYTKVGDTIYHFSLVDSLTNFHQEGSTRIFEGLFKERYYPLFSIADSLPRSLGDNEIHSLEEGKTISIVYPKDLFNNKRIFFAIKNKEMIRVGVVEEKIPHFRLITLILVLTGILCIALPFFMWFSVKDGKKILADHMQKVS